LLYFNAALAEWLMQLLGDAAWWNGSTALTGSTPTTEEEMELAGLPISRHTMMALAVWNNQPFHSNCSTFLKMDVSL
jgi:hypothetical protein